MSSTLSRRGFLKATVAVGAGLPVLGAGERLLAAEPVVQKAAPNAAKRGWEIGCQLYTFRSMPFYDALDKISAIGFSSVEPCFFLPLSKESPDVKTNETLSPAARKELGRRLADAGIRMTNFYGDLGTDADDCRKKFDFAKEMGVENFIAEPPPEAFDAIEKLCDEYKINLAVHNHPKSPDSKYWDPENVLKVCKGRSKRIGGCCDTGHWVRSGLDPVECLKKMEGRIITFHLKDVAEWGNPAARDVPLGTGKAKYMDVCFEIRRQRFRGVLCVEYEHESPQLVDDLKECLAFVEKCAAMRAG